MSEEKLIARIGLPIDLEMGVALIAAASEVCGKRGQKAFFRNGDSCWEIYEVKTQQPAEEP